MLEDSGGRPVEVKAELRAPEGLPVEEEPHNDEGESIKDLTARHAEFLSKLGVTSAVSNHGGEQKRVKLDPVSSDALRKYARRLRDASETLDSCLFKHSGYREDPGSSAQQPGDGQIHSSIDIDTLVAYAHRICYTTFAPKDFASGQVPLRGALPPAPQDEHMRASQLYQAASMDVGIPSPVEEPPPPQIPDLLPPATTAAPKAAPSELPLPPPPTGPPPGWRPGMPVELPPLPPSWKVGDPLPGLPLNAPPPGWKPGDPLPLPGLPPMPPGWKPGDALPPLPMQPVALAPKAQPLAAPRASPAAIQVQHVKLDLNPDLDDDDDFESDFSDDDEDED